MNANCITDPTEPNTNPAAQQGRTQPNLQSEIHTSQKFWKTYRIGSKVKGHSMGEEELFKDLLDTQIPSSSPEEDLKLLLKKLKHMISGLCGGQAAVLNLGDK